MTETTLTWKILQELEKNYPDRTFEFFEVEGKGECTMGLKVDGEQKLKVKFDPNTGNIMMRDFGIEIKEEMVKSILEEVKKELG